MICRQLQPDEHEQRRVEQEDEDLPERDRPAMRVVGVIRSGARQPR